MLHLITSQVQAETEPLWAESDAAKLAIYLPTVHPLLMSHPPPGSIQTVIYSKTLTAGYDAITTLPCSRSNHIQVVAIKDRHAAQNQLSQTIGKQLELSQNGNTNNKNSQKLSIHGRGRRCKQQQQPHPSPGQCHLDQLGSRRLPGFPAE